MAKDVFRIEGLKELHEALQQLPTKATAKNVMRRVLKKRAQPIADRARELVPVDQGNLRDSIIVTTKLPEGHDPGKAAFARAMRAGASRQDAGRASRAARRAANPNKDLIAEVFVGPGRYPHAHMVEFGTKYLGPRPYLRPAFDAGKMGVLKGIADDMWAEIRRAAERAARKAVKAKARGK